MEPNRPMFENLLLRVEDRFDIPGRGLVISPDLAVPRKKAWRNFEALVEIEADEGGRSVINVEFMLTHFNVREPRASVEERWRIVLSLPTATKQQVPIGARVFVLGSDYARLIEENGA